MIDGEGYILSAVPGGTFHVTYGGALYAAGGVTSAHGGPYLQTTGSCGTTVTAYSDHTTAPEMDDVCEAQLVNGRAFVPIDAELADVIDLRRRYHVFVTPEGEVRGFTSSRAPAVFSFANSTAAGRR